MQTDWVHEAVFGFKEAGLKLDVTTWVPRFMQSVLEKEKESNFDYALVAG